MFNKLRVWLFKLDENKQLREELLMTNQCLERAESKLREFSDSTNWWERYDLEDCMVMQWRGVGKPWLDAEETVLLNRLDEGEIDICDGRLEQIHMEQAAYTEY